MSNKSTEYKLKAETIMGYKTFAQTADKESMRIMLPGMQASNDVKSFEVTNTELGHVKPEHFQFSSAFFTKWK